MSDIKNARLKEAVFKFERPEKIGFKAGPLQYVSEDVPPEQKGEAVCFDLSGQLTDDEKKCAAKYVKNKDSSRYFVKWCLEGPDKGHPLNPYSVYFKEGDEVRMDARKGRHRYEFKSVNKDAFELYLKFLKTKIASYCREVERIVLNG